MMLHNRAALPNLRRRPPAWSQWIPGSRKVAPRGQAQLLLPVGSRTAQQLGRSLRNFTVLNLIGSASSSGDAREITLTAQPDWTKTPTKYILHGLNSFRKEREAQALGSSCEMTF